MQKNLIDKRLLTLYDKNIKYTGSILNKNTTYKENDIIFFEGAILKVTVAGTTVVVTLVAGLVAVPLNNAKNTAQGNYQRVLTRFNEIKEEKYTLGQKIEELETKVNDLEKEKLGLQTQIQQAEQPAEEEEDTEEAEEPEEVTEEQAEITPYIPTMEDEQA